MGFLKKLATFGVILSIILAAMLYHPIHEDITDRSTTRIAMAIWKISKYIVSSLFYSYMHPNMNPL